MTDPAEGGRRSPHGSSRAATAEGVRRRILAAAAEQFRESGYERTSLQDIGSQVGLTRGAVLYHFRSKPELMSALLQPFVAHLDAALDGFEAAGTAVPPRRVLDVVLDALIEHPAAAELLARDISGTRALDMDLWFTRSVSRLVVLLCPDSPHDEAARIRGLAALGAIVRPLVALPRQASARDRDVIRTAALNALRRPPRTILDR